MVQPNVDPGILRHHKVGRKEVQVVDLDEHHIVKFNGSIKCLVATELRGASVAVIVSSEAAVVVSMKAMPDGWDNQNLETVDEIAKSNVIERMFDISLKLQADGSLFPETKPENTTDFHAYGVMIAAVNDNRLGLPKTAEFLLGNLEGYWLGRRVALASYQSRTSGGSTVFVDGRGAQSTV